MAAIAYMLPIKQYVLYVVCRAPRGTGAPPFPLVHSLPLLLLFFLLFPFLSGFNYFLFCPSLYFLPE